MTLLVEINPYCEWDLPEGKHTKNNARRWLITAVLVDNLQFLQKKSIWVNIAAADV